MRGRSRRYFRGAVPPVGTTPLDGLPTGFGFCSAPSFGTIRTCQPRPLSASILKSIGPTLVGSLRMTDLKFQGSSGVDLSALVFAAHYCRIDVLRDGEPEPTLFHAIGAGLNWGPEAVAGSVTITPSDFPCYGWVGKSVLVGGALGLVNIDIMEREGLVEQSAEVGRYLRELLAERVGDHPHVGEVRGQGQMIAVEFVADKAARRFFEPKAAPHRLVAAKGLEHGVLTRPLPFIEVNSFSPPLSMTRSEAEDAVERYGKALDAATPDLARLAAAK